MDVWQSQVIEQEKDSSASGAARRRAAVELIAAHGAELRRTARRFSICAEDAEDAYQRALEILLTKAPGERPRELVRWMQTVTRHEALAVRRERERLLGAMPQSDAGAPGESWVDLIPDGGDGPAERLDRRELIARSREALRSLKPAELRALTLLGAGYSYAEISERTGFSRTKVNRCLAEGRERFRAFVSRSEDGIRCRQLRPLLSAFCDGEAAADEAAAVREHLRACAACRATMRAYRAAPGAAAALAPALPAATPLLGRVQELLAGLQSRLPGGGGSGEAGAAQVAAAAGTRGAGMAAAAKLLAVCAGTAGGVAAGVAAGVAPDALDPRRETRAAAIERIAPGVTGGPARDRRGRVAVATPRRTPRSEQGGGEAAAAVPSPPLPPGPIEAAPPEAPPPAAPAAPAAEPVSEAAPAGGGGDPAGEFGP